MVTITYEYYTVVNVDKIAIDPRYSNWIEKESKSIDNTVVTKDEENKQDIKTITTTTTTTYEREVLTGEIEITTTTKYQVKITTTYSDGTTTILRDDPVVYETNTNQEEKTTPSIEVKQETTTKTETIYIPWLVEEGDGNRGHGNNTDGQDDDNPGKGGGGPNSRPKDGKDEDEGQIGNQGDDTPGVGNNKGNKGDHEPPVDSSNGPQGNNGFGNGNQDAPGNSLTNNNAENAGGTNAIVYPGNSNKGDSDPSVPPVDSSNGSKGNNGFGNGNQDAPGNSLTNNNAENAGGINAIVYPGNSNHIINDLINHTHFSA